MTDLTKDWLDEVLENLLGEYHEHKCSTCNGANGGCINCRKTGYDQTPCKICDKDGIAFKNRKEAKQTITDKLREAVGQDEDENDTYGLGKINQIRNIGRAEIRKKLGLES